MTDYLSLILADAAKTEGETPITWSVTFIDGETLAGSIEHIDGTAYALCSDTRAYYFSSSQVVRLNISR